jgi:hypothetical protein
MGGLTAGAWLLMVAPILVGLGLVVPFYLAHRREGNGAGGSPGVVDTSAGEPGR